jgi:8-oxo-dGTP diphosphatase
MSVARRPPLEVTCALLERAGRLLLARRPSDKALALKWEFPGGKIEAGESGPAALARELREELGIDVEVGRELAPVIHDYGGTVIRLRSFLCRLRAGEPQPHEHTAVRWCTPAEAASLDLADADRPVLAHFIRDAAASAGGI